MTRLSETALRRHAAAMGEAEGLAALGALVTLLDPDGTRSRWDVSKDVADRLRRFEGAAYQRLRSGARPPRNLAEALLLRLAESSLARDPRNICRLIV